MNDDAGDGRTRLEAAKSALGEVIKVLPEDAQVGLRVYGSKVSDVSRAEGCRDSALVSPVGPLDRDALSGARRGAAGQGPHADRPLAAGGARATCPSRACAPSCWSPTAATTARRRTRARRPPRSRAAAWTSRSPSSGCRSTRACGASCECIADAGGGSYVDANDPDALRDELLAALARAFRSYEPSGTPVEGGPPEQAPQIGEGQYLDAPAAGRGALLRGRARARRRSCSPR